MSVGAQVGGVAASPADGRAATATPVAAGAAVALVAWSAAASISDPSLVPGPWAVARAFVEMSRGPLLLDAATSLGRVAVGFVMAAVAGVLLGAVTVLLGRWGTGLQAVVEVLRPIPPIAWVPLAVLWLGLGSRSAWLIVFLGSFFPTYVNVVWGLSKCPVPYLELARSLGASHRFTLLRVRIPAALPAVVAGLRTALGVAWTSVIAAELVGAQSGLGYRIQMYRVTLETDKVVVGMLTIGLLGMLTGRLGAGLERLTASFEARS